MKAHYADDLVTLYHGDCLDVLRELPDASVDAVVTDPPYGLEFMGKEWDSFRGSAASHADARNRRADELDDPVKGRYIRFAVNAYEAGVPFQQWCEQWAAECLRVLKPGGHLLAFGGTRTWHRLACAIEDAGFEVRDSIAWLYGSGFPKSLDVSKAIDKAAGAEREVVQSIPDRWAGKGNVLQRANQAPSELAHITTAAPDDAKKWQGWGTALKPAFEPIVVARKPLIGTVAANVLQYGTGALNIDGTRIGTTETLGRAKGGWGNDAVNVSGDGGYSTFNSLGVTVEGGRWPANVVLDESQAAELDRQSGTSATRPAKAALDGTGSGSGEPASGVPFVGGIASVGYDDSGGASRFFYVAKAPQTERPRDGQVAHPTVKPLDLMRWLVRLVTPPGGTVLEPFAGSGTTAEACVIEGFKCIAIERETDYLPLIVQRLTKPIQPDLFGVLNNEDGAA